LTPLKLSKRRLRPAVFFDRDGTINVDTGYAFRPDDLTFMRALAETLPEPLSSAPLQTIIAAVDRMQGQEQIA